MSIDSVYYHNQSLLRGVVEREALENLCLHEARRLGERLKKYLSQLKARGDCKVLDVPCGYGNMLFVYRQYGIPCVGYDLDQGQVELARMLELNAIQKNVFEINHDQESMDAISSLDFLEHLPKDDALSALQHFHKLLKPEGLLILRMPCADFPMGLRDFAEDPTHKWIATSACLSSMLTLAGFSTLEVLEDWPCARRFTLVREFIAKPLRWMVKGLWFLTGFGIPRCMSSSMLVVARKRTS